MLDTMTRRGDSQHGVGSSAPDQSAAARPPSSAGRDNSASANVEIPKQEAVAQPPTAMNQASLANKNFELPKPDASPETQYEHAFELLRQSDYDKAA